MPKKPNKLINEKSPYLLQHANNPVDWYPWGEEAFKKAEEENKPVFLSIGYATCHWCHVMEKESFEDEEVAELLNSYFVSIKVDREERPDIDGIYMAVCQMLTGSGGWPLTIIMTPDKKPFFAGTYFPKYNKFNRIGMIELIPRLNEIWNTKKEEVVKSSEEITQALNNRSSVSNTIEIGDFILKKTFDELNRRFDNEFGGFGDAPKFPSPHNLLFLLRYWRTKGDDKAIEMVEKTLTWMRLGGIYDHLGFGFARYSTDRKWLVPHFEKMLYDQAMLAIAYTETYLATENNFYKKTAEEILSYVLRDMTHPEGGFYSAEDADSEGEEGKFYLWHIDEIRNNLDKPEYDLAVRVFNVAENGNWIDESIGKMPGTNILHLKKSIHELANEMNISENKLIDQINLITKKLFYKREKRVHPLKDDKILTDWNALMISAFSKAAQAFGNETYSIIAKKAYEFIEKKLTDSGGRLLHRFREDESGLSSNLDDYAFLIQALLDLYETTFDPLYIKRALELNDIMMEEFWDEQVGGFYFTSSKSEKMIARQKEIYDGAIPSGNSVALINLLRLANLTANFELKKKADELVKNFSYQILQSPSAFSMFICGLDVMFAPSTEIVIVTESMNDEAREGIELIMGMYNPNRVIVLKRGDEDNLTSNILRFTESMKMKDNKATFYICRNYACNQPVNSLTELKVLLAQLL